MIFRLVYFLSIFLSFSFIYASNKDLSCINLLDINSFQQGCEAYNKSDYKRSSDLFNEALDQINFNDSNSTTYKFQKEILLSFLLKSYIQCNDFESVLKLIDETFPSKESSQNTLYLCAIVFQKNFMFNKAIDLYKRILNKDKSTNLLLLLNYAFSLSNNSNFSESKNIISSINLPDKISFNELRLLAHILYKNYTKDLSQNKDDVFVLEWIADNKIDNKYLIDIKLYLCQNYLNLTPPKPLSAKKILNNISTQNLKLSSNQIEILEYYSLWIDIIEKNINEFISKGEKFIINFPNSTMTESIKMLLGKYFFLNNNINKSLYFFSEVSQKSSNYYFKDYANFFSAKSLSILNLLSNKKDIINKWEKVIDSSQTLELESRKELADIFLSLNEFEKARYQFSKISKKAKINTEIWFLASSSIAYSYYIEALKRGKSKELIKKSIDIFDNLLFYENLKLQWTNEIRYRKAKCYENLDRINESLDIYNDILGSKNINNSIRLKISQKELEWIFRSGFSMIDILLNKKKYKELVKISDFLSIQDNPRSILAKKISESIKLKHFIWD